MSNRNRKLIWEGSDDPLKLVKIRKQITGKDISKSLPNVKTTKPNKVLKVSKYLMSNVEGFTTYQVTRCLIYTEKSAIDSVLRLNP